MRRMAILLGLLAGCGSARCKVEYRPPAVAQPPFLWEASHPSGGRAYLFGTYHAAGEKDVPAGAWKAFAGAQVFAAEMDLESPGEASPFLPRGTSLQKLLPADDFYDLQVLLELRTEALSPLKPWVAMAMLVNRAYPFPRPSMDGALIARARRDGKDIAFLETGAEQVAALDESVTAKDLSNAIRDYSNMRCVIERDIAAYRAGDAKVVAEGVGELGDAQAVTLLFERNKRWLAQLDGWLAAGKVAFVAVGVGHLVGADNLIELLEARGVTVRRVANSNQSPAANRGRGPILDRGRARWIRRGTTSSQAATTSRAARATGASTPNCPPATR